MYSDKYIEKIIHDVGRLNRYDEEFIIPADDIKEIILTMAELGYIAPDLREVKKVDWNEHLEQARAGLIKSTSQMLALCGGQLSGGRLNENDHLLCRLSNAYWFLLEKYVALEKILNQEEGKMF